MEERYGSDPEAREAVHEEFEAAVRELDARLEQEQRQRTGVEAKRIHEEHEQRLKKVRWERATCQAESAGPAGSPCWLAWACLSTWVPAGG